jgi:polysaccharide export outer membrane protein
MKLTLDSCSDRRFFALRWALLVIAVLALFNSVSRAQCVGGDAPDSLGCPDASDLWTQLKGSPASVSIQEPSETGTPHPEAPVATSMGTSIAGNTSAERTILHKPEPLTEFQRFVAASTGQTLPIYGEDLFSSVPVTFGPLDHGPAPAEMIVGVDDELRVRVWGQVNFSADVRVGREGAIYIPKVGAVHVAGLPFSEVAAHLRTAMERVYRNFELSVDAAEIHSVQIYVTGLAHRPGEYTVSALSTLVDAVFACGGPAAPGSMRHVLLKRSGKVVTDFDLYALLIHGEKTGDVQLQPGDVLYIPPAGPQVALLGSVRKAGIFELRGNETINDLLDAAGGRTAIATGAHLSLERIEDQARRRAFEIAIDQAGLATPLADGDLIRIDPIISAYRDTVTLRGAVASPGHFRWHTGMRLSELMPDRGSVVKRDYWWERTQLGLPAPEFISSIAAPDPKDAAIAGPDRQEARRESQSAQRPAAVESPTTQTNWNNAVIERLDASTMTTSLIPFALGKLVLEHDVSQDLELMPGDVVTVFTQSEIQNPIREQTKYVTLEGEFVHPGVYSASPGETLRSLVARAGGLTPQAYLYAATFSRRSTKALEQQHLNEFADQLEHELLRRSMVSVGVVAPAASLQGLALNRELIDRIRSSGASGRIPLNSHPGAGQSYEIPEMHLEDGDRFAVPFSPETVQVLGAVFNPHAFIYHEGARADEYLRLAGGPNRDADRKRIFLLRADGTVSIRDMQVFTRSVGELRLHPGDSVIVPEKTLHMPAIAQILAWTQALSQASLPAIETTALTR